MTERKRTYIPNPTKEQAEAILDAIRARCTECPECGEPWNWTGNHKRAMHHAVVERNLVRVGVRKAIWVAFRGAIPANKVLTTTCDNPCCLNPQLAAAVTRTDVIHKMMEEGVIHNAAHLAALTKARRSQGTKLSLEIAREIRSTDISTREYAQRLGVTRQMISRIRQGKSYSDANVFRGLGAR